MLDGFREQIAEWRVEAERARGRQENPGYARGLEVAADDLERRLSELANQAAPIRECVEISGVSRSTLYRLMEAGLENVGEPGAPRLRILDLPFEAGKLRNLLLGEAGRPAVSAPSPPPPKPLRRDTPHSAPKSAASRLPRQPLEPR